MDELKARKKKDTQKESQINRSTDKTYKLNLKARHTNKLPVSITHLLLPSHSTISPTCQLSSNCN